MKILSIMQTSYIPFFKGYTETLTGKSYDQDYDETIKDNEFKMPYRSIYLTDANKKIEEIKHVTDIPMDEFISDNLGTLIKQSSHYNKNSSIEKYKSIERKDEIKSVKVKNAKIDKKTGVSSYNCKIYFADQDEKPNSEIRNAHNIIVHDKRPEALCYQDLVNVYIDKTRKSLFVPDKNLKNQKYLNAVIDYYTRKLESENDMSDVKKEHYQMEINHASRILKAVKRIDKNLEEINKLKQDKVDDNSEKIDILYNKTSKNFSLIKKYYEKNMPSRMKSHYFTTRYL